MLRTGFTFFFDLPEKKNCLPGTVQGTEKDLKGKKTMID
jgi:hypothetical protein